MDDDLLNIEQAAKRLRLGKSTLKKMVAARSVPFTRPGNGKSIRFTPEHIAAIIAAGEQPVVKAGQRGGTA